MQQSHGLFATAEPLVCMFNLFTMDVVSMQVFLTVSDIPMAPIHGQFLNSDSSTSYVLSLNDVKMSTETKGSRYEYVRACVCGCSLVFRVLTT